MIAKVIALFLLVLGWIVLAGASHAIAETELWQTRNEAGKAAFRKGNFDEGRRLLDEALEEAQKYGSDDPRVAAVLLNFGRLSHRQRKYSEAESYHQRSLVIRESALGPDHILVAQSLAGIGRAQHAQRKYTDAERNYLRALEILENALGKEHSHVGTALVFLGRLYFDEGRLEEAEPLYERALAIRERELGSEHPRVVSTLKSLANLYRARGRLAEAESLLKRANTIQEKKSQLRTSSDMSIRPPKESSRTDYALKPQRGRVVVTGRERLSATTWALSISVLVLIVVALWRWSGTALLPASVVDKEYIGEPFPEGPPLASPADIPDAHFEGRIRIASDRIYKGTSIRETVTFRAFILETLIVIFCGLVLVDSGATIFDWFNEEVIASPILFGGIAVLCFVVALPVGAVRQAFGSMLSRADAIPVVDDRGRPKFAYLGDYVPHPIWQHSPWFRAATWVLVAATSLLGALIGSLAMDQLLKGALIPTLVAILVLRWLISSIPERIAQHQIARSEAEP